MGAKRNAPDALSMAPVPTGDSGGKREGLRHKQRHKSAAGVVAHAVCDWICGAKRDRTADLLVANEALSQLL
jgi:hypothetical protein